VRDASAGARGREWRATTVATHAPPDILKNGDERERLRSLMRATLP
jgi:hypothetical protein